MKKIFFLLSLLICFLAHSQTVLTNNNHVTVVNKTMDYNLNTFLNFPTGSGSVTSIATTNGFGIISSVANPTTTPNITIAVDSSNLDFRNYIIRLARDSIVTLYTGDGSLNGDRIVDMNGHILDFINGGVPVAEFYSQGSLIQSYDASVTLGNKGKISTSVSTLDGGFDLLADFNDGGKLATISGISNASSSAITYTADTHTFIGKNLSVTMSESGSGLSQVSSIANNNSGDGNSAVFSQSASDVSVDFFVEADFNDGVKRATISGNATASASSLSYTADTHTFNIPVTGLFHVNNGSDDLLSLDNATFQSRIEANDGASGHSRLDLHSNTGLNDNSFDLLSDDGVAEVKIFGNSTTNSITHTARKHIFTDGTALQDSLVQLVQINNASQRGLFIGQYRNPSQMVNSDSAAYNIINAYDSIGVTNTNTTSFVGRYPASTLRINRETTITANNISIEMMGGQDVTKKWIVDGIDSVNFAPSGSDFIWNTRSRTTISNKTAAHRAVINSGPSTDFDVSAVHISTLEMDPANNTSTHLVGDWGATISYLYDGSTSGQSVTDTIDQFFAFFSTNFLQSGVLVKKYYDYASSTNGIGRIGDSLFFLFQRPTGPSPNGRTTNASFSYIDGKLSIGGGRYATNYRLEVNDSAKIGGVLTLTNTPPSSNASDTILVKNGNRVLGRSPADFGFGTVTSVSGTLNRITSTGGNTPVIDISASYVGQSSITTLGTITTGVWNGTAIANGNLANSTISGISLGSNLNDLTVSTGLQLNSGTTYNGGTAKTISGVDATTAVKGIASYTASDFDVTAGAVSIDYTNGQAGSATLKGFITSTDWSTFNGKQDALVSGTNIQTINGTSILGSGNEITEYSQLVYTALGSVILGQTFDKSIYDITASKSLADGSLVFFAVYLPQAATLTGVKWYQTTAGNYTADNYNGVGLYSYSGGNLTLVASSTNDGNIWKTTSGTWGSKAFTSTYAASAGVYYLALLYNQSAQTTAPALGAPTSMQGNGVVTMDFTNSAKIAASLAAQTALPSPTQAMSGLTANGAAMWYMALY